MLKFEHEKNEKFDFCFSPKCIDCVLKQYQPERLSEKTYYRSEDGIYEPLEPVIGSDSLNSMET